MHFFLEIQIGASSSCCSLHVGKEFLGLALVREKGSTAPLESVLCPQVQTRSFSSAAGTPTVSKCQKNCLKNLSVKLIMMYLLHRVHITQPCREGKRQDNSGTKNTLHTLLTHHYFPKGGPIMLIRDRKGNWSGECVCSISKIQVFWRRGLFKIDKSQGKRNIVEFML